MFDWLNKPYIEWSFIDNIICHIEIIVLIILILLIACFIINLKDNIKK